MRQLAFLGRSVIFKQSIPLHRRPLSIATSGMSPDNAQLSTSEVIALEKAHGAHK